MSSSKLFFFSKSFDPLFPVGKDRDSIYFFQRPRRSFKDIILCLDKL